MSRSKREKKRIPGDWAWLDAISGKFDEDFIAAVNEAVSQQERPQLEAFFNSLPDNDVER